MKAPTLFQRAATWLATKAAVGPTDVLGLNDGSWRPIVGEPFSGAWQRNIALDTRGITAFSAVYACITIRARDIAKLRIKLVEQDGNGIWSEVRRDSPFLKVLRKPNSYQTRVQFIAYWIVCKLTYGNVYVYKERDRRGIVTDLHILDPRRVTVKVANDGAVWYDLGGSDKTRPIGDQMVPASEIIHDRCICLFHPLIGVSPIYAACASATQGTKIQENSQQFFANMSAPSGHLSAPAKIDDVTAERMRRDFEAAKGGTNLGKLLVTGDGMKYEPFSMPAVEAQLIEQLRWTVEDVARCFGVPLHKIMAGAMPQVGNMAALEQGYYGQTLQEDIEAIEILLDEGLGLVDVPGQTLGTELDLDGLLRMDPLARADRLQKLAGVMKIDEMRASENMAGTTGGGDVYLQQQNFSLSALAKRDAMDDPFASKAPPAAPVTAPAASDKPAPVPEAANDKALELASLLTARFLKDADHVAA